MKDLLLIPVLLATFAFGYYVMARLDHFIEENQRLIDDENRSGQSKIRIAAESTALLDAVAAVLEDCSNADPHLQFFLSRGRTSRILEKLLEEQIDIVLLGDGHGEQLDRRCSSLRIPCGRTAASTEIFGLPVEELEEDAYIRVVWKSGLRSKDRDRVIFALENEQYRLKCAYAEDMVG